MSESELLEGTAAGSRASACFLCWKKNQTGIFNFRACADLSELLLKEGVLALPPAAAAEEVCRFCLSDLWQLEELLKKMKEIKNQIAQTANHIKIRKGMPNQRCLL